MAQTIRCSSDLPRLSQSEIAIRLKALPDWQVSEDGQSITRELRFKGFAKATYAANLAIWLADQTNHHPDICLGYGYCRISYTTHEIGGLSEPDFICAERFDALLKG